MKAHREGMLFHFGLRRQETEAQTPQKRGFCATQGLRIGAPDAGRTGRHETIRTKVRLMNGQTFRISNPKNGVEESCRVVRSEVKEAEFYSVGFEFDRPSPNFWPIVFPPADWVEPVGGRYRS
jgi:hypothetical protein